MSDMSANNRLQNSFIYIMTVLLGLLYAFGIYVAVRCYIPYNIGSMIGDTYLDADAQRLLWSLMLLPSAVIPVALFLSNLLRPTLSPVSMLMAVICCAVFAVSPMLYRYIEHVELGFALPALVFFLVSGSVANLLRDVFPNIFMKGGVCTVISIVGVIVLVISIAVMGYFTLGFAAGFFSRTGISAVFPVVCIVCMLMMTSSVCSISTRLLCVVYGCYVCLICSFETLNKELLHTVAVGGGALLVIWMIIDIIKYFLNRRKENDSQSCNA